MALTVSQSSLATTLIVAIITISFAAVYGIAKHRRYKANFLDPERKQLINLRTRLEVAKLSEEELFSVHGLWHDITGRYLPGIMRQTRLANYPNTITKSAHFPPPGSYSDPHVLISY